jgi:uncharacterized protein
MKQKSTSKLALLSLRVLLGLFAAFVALALAWSHAVGDTLSCGPPATANWPGADTPSPTQIPSLKTNFYFRDLSTPWPVLVLRGCNGASSTPPNICDLWPANAHMVVQDIRENQDCHVAAFSGDMLYKFDQDDGHRMLQGIDESGWSQLPGGGHIAMYGWSNGGIVSYLAAVGATPFPLRGIQAHYATGDLLNYGLFNGGVQHKEIAYPVDLPQAPNQISWKDYVGLGIWNKYLITDGDAGNAKVAGLHVGGWFDVFGQAILDTYSRMQSAVGSGFFTKQKIVIGPWGHGDGAVVGDGYLPFLHATANDAGVQLNGTYDTPWKNAVLRGLLADWNAWNALPAVKVYHMNAPAGTEWRTYTTWPPAATELTFYFTPGRGLSGNHQSIGQLKFTSDPSNPCPTLGGINNLSSCASPSPVPSPAPCGSFDQRPIEAREGQPGDVVVLTSATVTGTVVGRMYADVWIQTDLPDVDIFVRMTDVFPDGHSMLMAQGIQRAAYRNGACRQPPLSNVRTLVHVDLGSTAYIFNTGHKLRVIVSAAAGPNRGGAPLYSINPQNGDEYVSVPPTNRNGTINVLTGPGQESAVVVPQVNPQATPPADHRPPKPTPCPQ